MLIAEQLNAATIRSLIRQKKICYAGNRRLRIYGTLHCVSGKRMRPQNRVFFASVQEAMDMGYRPCGHCLRAAYQKWKHGPVQ